MLAAGHLACVGSRPLGLAQDCVCWPERGAEAAATAGGSCHACAGCRWQGQAGLSPCLEDGFHRGPIDLITETASKDWLPRGNLRDVALNGEEEEAVVGHCCVAFGGMAMMKPALVDRVCKVLLDVMDLR